MKILCFEIKYTGTTEWKQLALKGSDYRLRAIKCLRATNTKKYGLKEAKDKVDAYMIKHGIEPFSGYFEEYGRKLKKF